MCKTCFEDHLPARLLAARCAVSIALVKEPMLKAIVTFTCPHGATHRHAVYPGTEDWKWCEYQPNDWCEVMPAPRAA